MEPVQTDVIARLRKDILLRQGLKKTAGGMAVDMGLGAINHAFPDNSFPLAAVHEFCCTNTENKTATTGFVAGLLSALMKNKGALLWISASRMLFPPAFSAFGIAPDRILFVELPREKDQLWMMEEALKCDGLSAVVGEIRNLDFTASRRLQLAVEQSKVTGFVIRQNPYPNTTACVSRWKITTLPSETDSGLPGIGFPRWNVALTKIRNGQPGTWQLEWNGNAFTPIQQPAVFTYEQQREAS